MSDPHSHFEIVGAEKSCHELSFRHWFTATARMNGDEIKSRNGLNNRQNASRHLCGFLNFASCGTNIDTRLMNGLCGVPTQSCQLQRRTVGPSGLLLCVVPGTWPDGPGYWNCWPLWAGRDYDWTLSGGTCAFVMMANGDSA